MAVFTAEQKALSRQLISIISRLQPKEENFDLCFQYVKSNFRHHRYLDVDSFKVTKTIKGLVEKFHVHGQSVRATALESLTESFLTSHLSNTPEKLETRYGVLQLLLCLSEQPTATSWTFPVKEVPVNLEEGDGFDWVAYLKEGIEFPSYSDSDSEWSQLSEDGEQRTDPTLVDTVPSNSAAVTEKEGKGELREDTPATHNAQEVSHSRSWLLNHVMFPYWNQSHPYHQPHPPPPPSSSPHPACTLAEQWRQYKERTDPLMSPIDSVTLDELNIVQETIWLLLGAEKSFVYLVNGEGVENEGESTMRQGEIGVRREVQLSHLTPLSLHRLLKQFASVATNLLKMRRFIKSVTHNMCGCLPPPSLPSVCQSHTYEALADALSIYIQLFNDRLRDMEQILHQKKEYLSLLRLSVLLHPLSIDVKVVTDVLASTINSTTQETGSSSESNQCVVRLLDCVWNGMQYYDTLGEAGTTSVKYLFPLWVMCVRPYLSAIGEWMLRGVLQDRHHELCIIRDESVIKGAGDYWERCFTVRGPIPQFLEPVLDKVMLAGKSRQLIESTGKLVGAPLSVQNVEDSSVESVEQTPSNTEDLSLHDEFVESLRCEMIVSCEGRDGEVGDGEVGESNVGEVGDGEVGDGEVGDGDDGNSVKEEETVVPLELHDMHPLLQQYLKSLTTHTISHDKYRSSRSVWIELQDMSGYPRNVPINVLIQRCLFPLIHNWSKKASSCLMHILHTEFDLLDHFKTVQLFLLMEAGDIMHHFASDIFNRILCGESWRDLFYLNSLLQEVLLPHYPHLDNCLSVQVDNEDTGHDLLSSITSLSIHYQVPWPVTTVFTTSIMTLYNNIFHFLMQVKWAKWSLESIQVKAHTLEVSSSLLHKLLLLRSKLLHFVNSIYHYLMTRILHSIGLQFQRQIKEATDLDSVLQLHRDYVNTIFDRCLLNKKASIVKEAMLKTLRLTLTFRKKWELGHFSYKEGQKIESEFSKCSHFLVTCLNNTVKRGSFPYLESLAFSIASQKTDQKIFTK